MSQDGARHHVASCDGLRGAALLAVVALHAATGALFATGYLAGAGGTLNPDESFTAVGEWVLRALPVAVYLFFALSGFLIARPFVEAFVLGRPRPPVAQYLRNRALRLYPAAWLMLAAVYLRHGSRDSEPGELLSTLTLTESYTPHPLESLIGQLWSLKAEVGFYLLVPVVFVAVSALAARRGTPAGRRRLIYGLAALGAAVSLGFSATAANTMGVHRSLPWVLVSFTSGLALAAALAGRDPRPEPRRARALAGAGFAAGVVLVLISGQLSSTPLLVNVVATLGVTALLWSPVVLEATGAPPWRWLTNPVIRWIGARSYAIYLWHLVVMSELYPLVRGIEGYRVAYLALLPLVLVASAIVAELSWRLVERPALRLRASRHGRGGPVRGAPDAGPTPVTAGATSP